MAIHSSELMPGGSPKLATAADIDKLYGDMEALFAAAASAGYVGRTLAEFRRAALAPGLVPSPGTPGQG